MKDNNKYVITVFYNNQIQNINLSEYEKNIITLGRDSGNDIVINSPLISENHCYFKLKDGELTVYDNNSHNGIYINNIKSSVGFLKNTDSIKIDNLETPLKDGVLILISIGNVIPQWKECDMYAKKAITIGRNRKNDIVIDRISVSLKHAKIYRQKDSYFLSCINNKNGIILNDHIITIDTLIKDKDIFIIDDVKFIFNNGKILYQISEYGVRLDAIDIVKTVKVKGKKRDISQHVDFIAEPGDFIAFVGVSGAGKSTFLKCISGVDRPTSGKVLLNGQDLFSNYQVLKNLIGYVPQENIIFDDLTLIDMLSYSANLRMPDDSSSDEKKQRIDKVIETVGLNGKKDVMIRNLSGGQQKRACIAVELLADPKLFFLDEPTSGLDPGTERSIMETLRKMANEGKTIILVTHNTLNLHLCDKVVFFGVNGRLCFDGKPELAKDFFNETDFVDIYKDIEADTAKWHAKFNNSKYKVTPQDNQKSTNNSFKKNKKSKSFFKQFLTLLRRRVKTLINNRQQLLLLFAQVPLIAYLVSLVITKNLFYSYEETKAILFMVATASIWLGLLNSIQEICKERVILKKEYMADLRLSSYLFSKIIYLVLLALIQSVLLIQCLVIFVDTPAEGLNYNWNIEMILISFVTILSASGMGLLVSVFTKNPAAAMTLPTILLVPQLLFSGMLFPLEGMVEKISNFIICRWSVEAFGTINDLNNLISAVQEVIPGFEREAEDYYTFTMEHLSFDISIMALMTVFMLTLSYYTLRKQLESGR